jgi:hypothetical protein
MCRGRRFGGLTSKCLGRLRGNSPFWRSCSALRHIAERGRCNRLAICDAEFAGHKVTNSRSSSSVQRDMAGLVMVAPAPGAMTADSCGAILVIASIPRHQGCKPGRISTNSALNLPGRSAWLAWEKRRLPPVKSSTALPDFKWLPRDSFVSSRANLRLAPRVRLELSRETFW